MKNKLFLNALLISPDVLSCFIQGDIYNSFLRTEKVFFFSASRKFVLTLVKSMLYYTILRLEIKTFLFAYIKQTSIRIVFSI